MLITVKELVEKWGVHPNGVLHVGAHLAEELPDYINYGFQGSNKLIWVEAQPMLASNLSKTLDPKLNLVICAAAWNESGLPMKLHLASNSQSSSLLDFEQHLKIYPSISYVESIDIETSRLDAILPTEYFFNFVNVDIQGSELKALQGLEAYLGKVDWIYCEVNKKPLYFNSALVGDLDEFLRVHGFRRLITKWVPGRGWGDALYVRRSKTDIPIRIRAFSFLLSQKKDQLLVFTKSISKKLRKKFGFY
jgi:FkbM family methyltransferase